MAITYYIKLLRTKTYMGKSILMSILLLVVDKKNKWDR